MVKAKAKVKEETKETEQEPEFKKPWASATLVRFKARTRRVAPSPSQKSLEYVGTQGYGLHSPNEIFFVDKADARYPTYHQLSAVEIKSMLPKKEETTTKK